MSVTFILEDVALAKMAFAKTEILLDSESIVELVILMELVMGKAIVINYLKY
jgi:hypothetical protein